MSHIIARPDTNHARPPIKSERLIKIKQKACDNKVTFSLVKPIPSLSLFLEASLCNSDQKEDGDKKGWSPNV